MSTGSGSSTPVGNSTLAKSKKAAKPSAEEIEAKRQVRAAKKEQQVAEEKAKQAELDAAIAANGKIPNGHLDDSGNVLFVPRDWASTVPKGQVSESSRKRIKVVSWNILAQGLVRRTLFPGSDCLKFKDRSIGLAAELSSRTGHGWDVGTFQEVDRVDVHGPMLEKDGFSYVYEKGYRQKQHGLLISWRNDMFGKSAYRKLVIDLDAESVSASSEPTRTACSRITRNIGLFVALQRHLEDGDTRPGIVVATTHLFWHPMHAYERARQSGILVRRLSEFRESLGEGWGNVPCVFAGDFNDQPHSANYHLLTGQELTKHCIEELQLSSVVHKSIDERSQQENYKSGFAPGTTETAQDLPKPKSATQQAQAAPEGDAEEDAEEDADEDTKDHDEQEGDEEEGEGEEGGADDQMLKNCRPATPEDGLLSIDELNQLHNLSQARPSTQAGKPDLSASSQALHSCYGRHYDLISAEHDNMFGSPQRGRERWDDASWTPGQTNVHTGDSKEPMWTIFSSLFSLTLDYIFLLPASQQNEVAKVTSLLRTHKTETLSPGVPRKGVCASDHVAIGAEIEL